MTIKELLKELEGLPEDFQVFIAKDGEGNSYSSLYTISDEEYIPESSYTIELRDAQECIEEDIPWNANCIVLWPTN